MPSVHCRISFLLILACLAPGQAARGQVMPYLVKDINPNNDASAGSSSAMQAVMGGEVFFAADDGIHGTELWKTDGTRAGTVMVKDIWPGPNSSDLRGLTVIRGKLYFSANDGLHGHEPWISDGTVAGTRMIADVIPGFSSSSLFEFAECNGQVYFHPEAVARSNGTLYHGQGYLWKTDGTAAGTVLVRNVAIQPNYPIGYTLTPMMANANGTLYFIGGSQYGIYPTALWKSDGTSAGTVMIKEVMKPANLLACNGYLFFTQDVYGLLRSDGTAEGTVPFNIGVVNQIKVINGKLLASATNSQQYYQIFNLWLSDGTTSGTRKISGDETNIISDFVAFGGAYYYLRSDYPMHSGKLMRCDENGGASQFIRTITLGPLVVAGGKIYILGKTENGTLQLWRSDGTTSGTVLVKEFAQDPLMNYRFGPPLASHGRIFFNISDTIHGQEPWVSDGSAAGTTMIRDIRTGADSEIANLTACGGRLFMTADDGAHGPELWKSDGTAAGTVMVKDIGTTTSADVGELTDVNGTLYFRACDGPAANQVWKSNGFPGGTVRVTNLAPGSGGCFPTNLFNGQGKLFFSAAVGNRRALWISNGTPGGTLEVPEILSPTCMAKLNSAVGVASGTALWNCTQNGQATLVHDFKETIHDMVSVGNLFVAATQFWKTGGSEATTQLVKDLPIGNRFSDLTAGDGTVNFVALNAMLWKSDGTREGTRIVKDFTFPLSTQTESSYVPHSLVNVNGDLFFAASDYVHGPELWKADANSAVVEMVKDIFPGTLGSDPQDLVAYDGAIYFTATDPVRGTEIWRSDGTSNGTHLFAEVSLGGAGSAPRNLTIVGDRLFFTAIDANANQGRELWALNLKSINAVRDWTRY